jgi:hypothetical protein
MKYLAISGFNKMLLKFFLVILSQTIFSQGDQSKKVTKSYPLTDRIIFNIENKYGNIDLRDWDKNEVKIDAEIILHNLDQSTAAKAFDNVEIVFNADDNQIRVSTNYKDEFFDLLDRRYSNDDKKFEVNYVVMMPSTLRTKLENKYGNVFISKLESPSTIEVQYGNLQINYLSAQDKNAITEVKLAYSKGTIETCQSVNIELSYSKISIQNGLELGIVSKYSKLEIEKGSSINAVSKYDTYDVGTLSEFSGEAHYSNFKFDAISKKIKIDTKYTDFHIRNVPASFDTITIKNSYGSVSIGIDPAASYTLDADARYANIRYPENSKVNRFQENTELILNGIVGQSKSPIGIVKIGTSYGGVNLVK